MKTRIVRNLVLAVMLAGLPFVTGNAGGDDSSATYDTPAATATSQPLPVPVVSQPAPPPVTLSSGAAEIVKLAQAGVGEDVMLAYVGNVKGKFSLGSDQIVYLNDLGVSGSVVKAMIQHDDAIDTAARDYATSQLPPTIPPPPTNPYPPAPTDDGTQPPMQPPPDSTVNPPDNNTVDYPVADDTEYFYDSLAPYGSWVYIAGLGRCWRPTVWAINHEWRPYGDHGRWLYSDCGWYWQSDYSWGWAAFHYGRWFEDANRGWVWAPGRVWAPAWVSWRRSADYCGWAPLPPSAKFFPGSGFAYGNHLVAANFEFGLQPRQYTYIPVARLSDYAPARYAVTGDQAAEIHSQTTVINHYTLQNNRVVNHGIPPEEVAAVARTEIRRAEVIEEARGSGNQVLSDHLGKQGGSLVIYHPQLPAPSAHRAPVNIVPSRNSGKTSLNSVAPVAPAPTASLPTAQPIIMSGETQPNARTETYPPGSLVVIGNRNPTSSQSASSLPNMKLSRPANASTVSYTPAPAQAWPEASTPAAGFNFNGNTGNAANNNYYNQSYQTQHATVQPISGQSRNVYVIPSHYTVAQQLSSYSQHNFTDSAASTDTQQRQAEAAHERADRESRVEARESRPVESRSVEIAHSMQATAAHYEPAPVSHAASAPAASSSSASSSRK
jgi:hypothetical protein